MRSTTSRCRKSWLERTRNPLVLRPILAFDITLGAPTNTEPRRSKIFGVEILNEGSGISIDDAVSEIAGHVRFRRRSSNKTWSPPPPALPLALQAARQMLLTGKRSTCGRKNFFSEECNVGGVSCPGGERHQKPPSLAIPERTVRPWLELASERNAAGRRPPQHYWRSGAVLNRTYRRVFCLAN